MTYPSDHKPRIALRGAVEKVLGQSGSAIVGDDLYDALRDEGWDLYRPEETHRVDFDKLRTGPALFGVHHCIPVEETK